MRYIDLHSHTRCSDGACSPREVLSFAEREGLSFFSVSDHNTVDAYIDIEKYRNDFSGRIIPAVELSTVFEGESIEILGYGIDYVRMKKLISENYFSYYEKQVKEAKLDTDAVLRCGAVLDDSFVKAMYHSPESIFDPSRLPCRPALLAELRRHPENARFFKSKEEFDTIDHQRFSREYLFNSRSTLYSDQSSLSPSIYKVIDMIRECGGLTFLAHPFMYSAGFIDRMPSVCDRGLDGVECHYGIFNAEQKKYLVDYCNANKLYKSGGSDFHGLPTRARNRLGYSDGERIEYSLVEDWIPLVEKSIVR